MAVAVTLNAVLPFGSDSTQNSQIVYGTFTFSGSYVTGGDIVNFTGFDQIKSEGVPVWVDILEQPAAGTVPSGYEYVFCPGTTPANGKIVVMQGAAAVSSPNAQLPAGAYPAGITGAVIGFQAFFPTL